MARRMGCPAAFIMRLVKHDGTAEAWGYQNSGGDASGRDLTNVASAMCGWQAS